MIDFEDDLRRRLREAAATQPEKPELLAVIERRAARSTTRGTVLRAAAAVAAMALAGGAVVAVARAGSDPTERAVASPPTTPAGPGWHPLDSPLSPRMQNVAVAMGDLVLVWGGYSLGGGDDVTDGAVYDTTTGSWSEIPDAPLSSRGDAIGAWTGTEAIVVSGVEGDVKAAAFDPATGTWRALPDPPLENAANAANQATWTGTELVVTGTYQVAGEPVGDELSSVDLVQVAIYDPASDTWREGSDDGPEVPIFADAVWTGTEVLVVGHAGGSGTSPGADVVRAYDPATDVWRDVPGAPAAGGGTVAVWTGDRLFVGGGGPGSTRATLLDPATGTWEPVPDAPLPFVGNERYAEVWTGTEVVTLAADGGRVLAFDPATRTWRTDPAPAEGERSEVPWVWAGGQVVLPGGGVETSQGPGETACCDPTAPWGQVYVP